MTQNHRFNANAGKISCTTNIREMVESDASEPAQPAKSILAVMVKGLFAGLEFPYMHFSRTELTGDSISAGNWAGSPSMTTCLPPQGSLDAPCLANFLHRPSAVQKRK